MVLRRQLADVRHSTPWITNEELTKKLKGLFKREVIFLEEVRRSYYDQGRYKGLLA